MKKILIMAAAAILALSCSKSKEAHSAATISVVPHPAHVNMLGDTWNAKGATVNYGADLDKRSKDVIIKFAKQLSLVSGATSKVTEGHSGKGFIFLLDKSMAHEAYSIVISGKGAIVKASGDRKSVV